jgi:hypothetical protein
MEDWFTAQARHPLSSQEGTTLTRPTTLRAECSVTFDQQPPHSSGIKDTNVQFAPREPPDGLSKAENYVFRETVNDCR